MQEVAALCDHIVILSEGRVVMAGSREALLAETGCTNLEDAFTRIVGSVEGLG